MAENLAVNRRIELNSPTVQSNRTLALPTNWRESNSSPFLIRCRTHWQIGRLGSLQDSVHVISYAPVGDAAKTGTGCRSQYAR